MYTRKVGRRPADNIWLIQRTGTSHHIIRRQGTASFQYGRERRCHERPPKGFMVQSSSMSLGMPCWIVGRFVRSVVMVVLVGSVLPMITRAHLNCVFASSVECDIDSELARSDSI